MCTCSVQDKDSPRLTLCNFVNGIITDSHCVLKNLPNGKWRASSVERAFPSILAYTESALFITSRVSQNAPESASPLRQATNGRRRSRGQNVRRRHEKLCETGWRHGEADPCSQPERGRPLPAPQPGHQEEEEALLAEEQVLLHIFLTQRYPRWGKGDYRRYNSYLYFNKSCCFFIYSVI